MDTPGAEDGSGGVGVGRLLYRLRLSARHVREHRPKALKLDCSLTRSSSRVTPQTKWWYTRSFQLWRVQVAKCGAALPLVATATNVNKFIWLCGYVHNPVTPSLASSLRSNSLTVFLHPCSTNSSNDSSFLTLWATQATPPIALGSFLPFTGRPGTNASARTAGGKNNSRKSAGRLSTCFRDACVEVMEHHGASFILYMSARGYSYATGRACLKHDSLAVNHLDCC